MEKKLFGTCPRVLGFKGHKKSLKQKGNGAGRVQLFQLVYLVKGGKTATWLAKVVGRKTLYLRDD